MTLRAALCRAARRLSVALFVIAAAAPASAQTLTLTESHATSLRGGSFANTSLASATLLETRASSDLEYERRVIMKFDTHNTISAGASIASATLTLTMAGGNTETRTLTAYRIVNSYDEPQATWNRRYSATTWSTSGGDLGEAIGSITVTNKVGSRVTVNLTSFVQAVVSGKFGSSRYARIALVDKGASSRDSYKQIYSDEAGDITVRPQLVVSLGTSSTVSDPEPAPSTSTTGKQLRVLMWNIHHGVGTDGKYDINRLATWMAKMTPDVILLNEVEKYTGWGNEDQPARFESLLESKTGKNWYRHFAQEFGNWSSNGKGHLILSTYPLDDTGYATITPSSGLKGAGGVSQVRITVNGRAVNFVLSHLDPESQTMRLTQAKDTIRWALTHAENRILGGDMNAWPDQTSIAEFNKTYYDSWTVAQQKGTATAPSDISPFGATKKGRIDYIFYSKTAPNLIVKSSKVYDTRESGVMPSDHRPVVTTFEVR
jgi:endonuclease/exonuclease/phosphatase family metal-dependent hydrolase